MMAHADFSKRGLSRCSGVHIAVHPSAHTRRGSGVHAAAHPSAHTRRGSGVHAAARPSAHTRRGSGVHAAARPSAHTRRGSGVHAAAHPSAHTRRGSGVQAAARPSAHTRRGSGVHAAARPSPHTRRGSGQLPPAPWDTKQRSGIFTGQRLLQIFSSAAVLLLAGSASTAYAQEIEAAAPLPHPIGSGSWYYRLGGGRPVLDIRADTGRTLQGTGLKWQADACGFDIRQSIRGHFNHLQRNLYGLEKEIVDSAQSLLRAGALSVLQRANPGMYDLITRGIADGKEAFDIAVRNCRQIQRDLEAGESPLNGWRQLARGSGWQRAREQEADPVEANRRIEEQAGEDGIRWVGGEQAGGAGQPPIRVTADVTAAGYHLWQPEDGGAHPLARIWDSPQAAAAWAVSVLGESHIRLCRDCEQLRTSPGQGFHKELHRSQAEITETVHALLRSGGRPDAGQLAALASPGMGIAVSPVVIQALREEPAANRAILTARLATDIALTRTLEKALLLRQLLRAGRREPHAAANDAARREVDRLLQRLESEIDNVLFEQRVRREVLAGTALALLERHNTRRARGAATLPGVLPAVAPPSLIEGGARRHTDGER